MMCKRVLLILLASSMTLAVLQAGAVAGENSLGVIKIEHHVANALMTSDPFCGHATGCDNNESETNKTDSNSTSDKKDFQEPSCDGADNSTCGPDESPLNHGDAGREVPGAAEDPECAGDNDTLCEDMDKKSPSPDSTLQQLPSGSPDTDALKDSGQYLTKPVPQSVKESESATKDLQNDLGTPGPSTPFQISPMLGFQDSSFLTVNASQSMHPDLPAYRDSTSREAPLSAPTQVDSSPPDETSTETTNVASGPLATGSSFPVPASENRHQDPDPTVVSPHDPDSPDSPDKKTPSQVNVGPMDESIGSIAVIAVLVGTSLLAFIVGYVSSWSGWVVSLFTRVSKDKALEHPSRNKIYQIVALHPGICMSDLSRLSDFNRGTVHHHVHILVRHGLLTMHRRGRLRHLYTPDETLGWEQKRRYATLRNERCRRIAAYVLEHPGSNQDDIRTALDFTRRRTYAFLRTLCEVELVEARRQGREVHYHPTRQLTHCAHVLAAGQLEEILENGDELAHDPPKKSPLVDGTRTSGSSA